MSNMIEMKTIDDLIAWCEEMIQMCNDHDASLKAKIKKERAKAKKKIKKIKRQTEKQIMYYENLIVHTKDVKKKYEKFVAREAMKEKAKEI